ncbi:MAG: ceramidase domain-containing protein [Gammaproteobacteria bacterium]
MGTKKEKIGKLLIAVSAIIILAVLSFISPISQDIGYHNFSDTSSFLSIPNTLNVLSNLPFLIVGIWGLIKLLRDKSLNVLYENKLAYVALFLGSALVAFGSGYYHLWPDNQTLVWDRLPMTIAFMGLVSIIISEFISLKLGKVLLLPLLLFGLFSVLYWHYTEQKLMGDLRPYVFVQFFPILTIPIVLLLFTPKFNQISCYWWLLATYVLAKVFEFFDYSLHEILTVVSGHSIKHIAAAVGLYILIKGYQTRDSINAR